MPDVSIIVMPYLCLERPSIAAGVLKAALIERGIETSVDYANLRFADEIGIGAYQAIAFSPAERQLGEWTFSGAAFPSFEPNHDEYLEDATDMVYRRLMYLLLQGTDFKTMTRQIREKATAFVDKVAQKALDSGAQVIGCTSVFQQQCASLAVLRRVRELDPSVTTVLGGGNCEGDMGRAVAQSFDWIDYVFSGESDEMFPDFCEQELNIRRGGRSSHTLPEAVFARSGSNGGLALLQAAPRAVIEDMEQVPTPDYDEYFDELKQCECGQHISPGLLIETSRGCWWGEKHHCTFCGLNGMGMGFRLKSPERVVNEFDSLATKYDNNRFWSVDNILAMQYFKSVLPKFAAKNAPYGIFFETKSNLSYQQMELLADAGIFWIQPGIESMHKGALDLIDKGNTPIQNVQLLKWARELGIIVLWNLLCNIPGEKEEWYEEMADWLPTVQHLQAPTGMCPIRYDRFSPYFNRAEEFGLKLAPYPEYSYVYPLDSTDLSRIAYFFVDESATEADRALSKGHKRVGRVMNDWVRAWSSLKLQDVKDSAFSIVYSTDQLPRLSMSRHEDGGLSFTDTRPCAVDKDWQIEGLSAAIYAACSVAVTRDALQKKLSESNKKRIESQAVDSILDELRGRKLLLSLDGYLLALATEANSRPYSSGAHYPGYYKD